MLHLGSEQGCCLSLTEESDVGGSQTKKDRKIDPETPSELEGSQLDRSVVCGERVVKGAAFLAPAWMRQEAEDVVWVSRKRRHLLKSLFHKDSEPLLQN